MSTACPSNVNEDPPVTSPSVKPEALAMLAREGSPGLVREVQRAHGEGVAWLPRQLDGLEAA